MRTAHEIRQVFPSATESGLGADDLARSRERFGANLLTPLPRQPLWKKFIEKFDEPIIKILLAAALLSMFVDLFQAAPGVAGIALAVVAAAVAGALLTGRGMWVPTLLFGSALVMFFIGLAERHPSVEGLAVMVAVILATGVAFASEYKSDREFEVLNTRKDALQVKVIRGGGYHSVPMDQVLVGDAVVLEMGDEIPADGRLLKATEMYVDQALMTGESEPVRKQPGPDGDTADGPEQPGCLYRGTQVVDGVGKMIVTEVGDATYLGQIARRLSSDADDEDEDAGGDDTGKRVRNKLTISKELTPLQLKLEKLADLISNVGYVAAVLIFLALLVRGLFVGEVVWPHSSEEAFKVAGYLLNYFVYMVIIIVVAVPEGLPMSVTVSLALAMQKMTRANSLVRQLVACETIGSATVICSDKTGTLTQNRMRVERLFADGKAEDRPPIDKGVGGSFRAGSAGQPAPIDWIALNAAVNSTANLEHKGDKVVTIGNSTEGALLQWLHEAGVEYEQFRLRVPPVYQVHFSSERKRMTTVVEVAGRLVALAKGAPEWVLEHSTHYLSSDGTAKEWTPSAREAVQAALHDAAGSAMRTLAFGQAELPPETSDDVAALHARREELENGLVFSGFVAIRDPLRDDVKDAVARCRDAGIEVKMITGDNVETARAIAYDIGLLDRRDAPIDTPDAVVLTSPELNARFAQLKASNDGEGGRNAIAERLAGVRVVARARPLDKYKLVELLQGRNEVVAVTGDGTNDAPALKKADVGLAMGITGTEVAKEASKIVLLDDSFATIVKAVAWGRSLYENIQRFIQFQLTINVSALTIAFLGPFFGVKPPFTVLQLLWINVIMDTFASIALCSEPPREGVMRLPPKRKDENIVTPAMVKTIFATATFFVVVMLTLLVGMENYHWFEAGSGPEPEGWDFKPLNVRQVTIFFTVYIFFQVWNQINCRSLVPEESGLRGLTRNPTFLMIAGTVAVVQVLIVSVPFIGAIFKVEPLGVVDWLIILAATASVLVFSEVMRRLRLAATTA